jgi:hypothetical protein
MLPEEQPPVDVLYRKLKEYWFDLTVEEFKEAGANVLLDCKRANQLAISMATLHERIFEEIKRNRSN